MTKPNILNPEWKYTPAASTDIRKLFARERKRLKEESDKHPLRLVRIPVRNMG